jgi:hypothetical protein
MRRSLLVVLLLLLAFAAAADAQKELVLGSQVMTTHVDGAGDPAIAIPRDWRFVGVGNGEHPNSTNLWFEGKDGTIYLVRGFTSAGTFTVKYTAVQKIPRR